MKSLNTPIVTRTVVRSTSTHTLEIMRDGQTKIPKVNCTNSWIRHEPPWITESKEGSRFQRETDIQY